METKILFIRVLSAKLQKLCVFFIRFWPGLLLYSHWHHTPHLSLFYDTVACRHVARQRQWNKRLYNSRWYVMAPQLSMFPRQQLHCNRGKVFSVRSVPISYKQGKLISWLVSEWGVSELEDCCGSVVVSCCCENPAAEAGDSSGTQRKGNVRRWKPLPSIGSEDTSVCNGEL
jgi:hypothetical protein